MPSIPVMRLTTDQLALRSPAAVAALDRGVLAVPEGRGAVYVYDTYDASPPQILTGIHSTPVTALCVSWRPWPCLYTGAADGIARWSLEFVGARCPQAPLPLDASWQGENELASELLTGDLDRAPAHIALDAMGDRLAACIDLCTLIVSCCSGRVLARLEGHGANVTSAAFRKDHPDSVVTIAEDRRFIVYDLKAASILYASCIVSSSPFISLATEDGGGRAAIGTSDGKVRLYDLATPDCRLLHTIDIPVVTGAQQQPWLKQSRPQAGSVSDCACISCGAGNMRLRSTATCIPCWRPTGVHMQR